MTNVAEEYIIGIDVGVNGALSIVGATGDLIAVFDMPCLADGPKGRRAINAALLAELVAKAHATQASVESIGPRPQEGAVGASKASWLPLTFLCASSRRRFGSGSSASRLARWGRRTWRARKRSDVGLTTQRSSPESKTPTAPRLH
jgi:hypothetical protein